MNALQAPQYAPVAEVDIAAHVGIGESVIPPSLHLLQPLAL